MLTCSDDGVAAQSGMTYLLDYGAGNVRSVVNAVRRLGFDLKYIKDASDFDKAERVIFPGVGAFGSAMALLGALGYVEPLRRYISSGRPFLGICLGMQVLFEGSDENPGVEGLGILPGRVRRFSSLEKAVPHMGWNHAVLLKETCPSPGTASDTEFRPSAISCGIDPDCAYYYVHSFAVPYTSELEKWALCTTRYGSENFVAALARGRLLCTQFHPEKSGNAGLDVLRAFLTRPSDGPLPDAFVRVRAPPPFSGRQDRFTKRIVAALDVRANDEGDLVVTKGDKYDVREKSGPGEGGSKGRVRNMGRPVDLARRYYEEEGVDEVCFLSITSFRDCPLLNQPMLEVLRRSSECVFVPVTVGGGVRDFVDPDGTRHDALEVAGEYFRSGADKVSIGTDAVFAAQKFILNGGKADGTTSIERIAAKYGSQAVVVSVDPRRVYVWSAQDTPHHAIRTQEPGPDGEGFCWFQCTVAGGRVAVDLDVHQLVAAAQALGAGEVLLNSVDRDGTSAGFDLELIRDVKSEARIPVVASSGAGSADHFVEVFAEGVEAALAAGIFHRREVAVGKVKERLKAAGVPVRD